VKGLGSSANITSWVVSEEGRLKGTKRYRDITTNTKKVISQDFGGSRKEEGGWLQDSPKGEQLAPAAIEEPKRQGNKNRVEQRRESDTTWTAADQGLSKRGTGMNYDRQLFFSLLTSSAR